MTGKSNSAGKKPAATPKAKAAPAPEEKKQETALAIPPQAMLVDPKSQQPYINIQFDLVLEGDAAEDTEPIILAAMKLLAPLSKEVQNGEEGAQPGRFYNTLTQEISESLIALPLYRYKERYMSLTPGEMGSPIVCSSRDGRGEYGLCTVNPMDFEIPVVKITDRRTNQSIPVGNCAMCPNKDFQTDPKTNKRSKPKCREVHYLVCLDYSQFRDDDEFVQLLVDGDVDTISELITNLYAIPFARTSLATIRQIRNMSRLSGGQWFARFWEFGSRIVPDSQFKYWTTTAKPMQGLDRNGKLVARSLAKFVERLRGYDKLHARLDEADVSDFDHDNAGGSEDAAGEDNEVD